MSILFRIFLVSVLLSGGLCFALEYDVEVIQVGPCGGGPMFRPVRWSPDGSQIAYFHGNKLMVADTLGTSREVFTIEYIGRAFEWVNDSEIVFAQREYGSKPKRMFRLSTVTLEGHETVLIEEGVSRHGRPSFLGPMRALGGAVYYRTNEAGVEKSYLAGRSREHPSTALANHYELRQVDNNLCKISLDGSDTTVLLQGSYSDVVLSQDGTKVMMHSPLSTSRLHVYDISGGSCDTVTSQRADPAEGISCGIGHYEFDPTGNRIIYMESCDDGHYNVGQPALYLYDLQEKESHMLAPLADSGGEGSPSFAPNGRYFSFNAGGNVYLARLEVK